MFVCVFVLICGSIFVTGLVPALGNRLTSSGETRHSLPPLFYSFISFYFLSVRKFSSPFWNIFLLSICLSKYKSYDNNT